MVRLIAAAGIAAVLAACQTPQRVETAFDPKAAEVINRQGKAKIDGHAFITRFDNKVMNASGAYVYLIPATAYARERFAKLYNGRKFLPATALASVESDPNYAAYTRKTKAESSGRFSFENVAAGEYYVATTVTWKDTEDSFFSKGGAIYETVSVKGKEDEVVKVVVNGL